MITYPNAKINIGLNILRKRDDGFHEIESIFYPVNWCDILEIVPANSGKGEVEFSSSGIEIPGDGNGNLCEQAYHILHKEFDLPSVKMHLHKLIPIGAGLGGGSADASFALKMLNTLFALELNDAELEKRAEELGSDCPFFIRNKASLVWGRGELMKRVDLDLSSYYIVLINPGIHIGTAEAYQNVVPAKPEQSLAGLTVESMSEWRNTVKNDFELSLFPSHPEIENLKTELYRQGAQYAAMTGSGSTVFGIFEQRPAALNFAEGLSVHWCEPSKV